jgi:hypothetical protein
LILELEKASWIATIVGVFIATAGFPLLIWQVNAARRQLDAARIQMDEARAQREDAVRLTRSQVLLAADGVLAHYNEIAQNLRPSGDWYGGDDRPLDSEMKLVEPYLGVFERIFIAVAEGQIDDSTLNDLYGYRLNNIWHNERIVDVKLQNPKRKEHWKHLIALTYVVEAQRGRRFALHTDDYFPRELFTEARLRSILKTAGTDTSS